MFNFRKNKFSQKIKSTLAWIATNSNPGDIVVITSNKKDFFFISDGEELNICSSIPNEIQNGLAQVAFLVSDNTICSDTYTQSLSVIYQDIDFSIFENPKRHQNLLPIRFGLTKDEKRELLAIARSSLVYLLNPDRSPSEPDLTSHGFERLRLCGGAGVALWVEGAVRGSMIIDLEIPLQESVVKAAKLAARDLRFKPITYEELTRGQIEITIIGEPKIEAPETYIDYSKGYLAVSEHGRGWYIPEVFNCRNFWNYSDFKNSLLSDKARVSIDSKYKIFNFTVEDFIEYEKDVLTFAGPIICKMHPKSVDIKTISDRAEVAATWISAIQEDDGNLPAVYDVHTGKNKQSVDWPRLAFTAWALAEFGKASGDEKYLISARNAYYYFEKYFLLEDPINIDHSRLGIAYAYAGNYLLTIDNFEAAKSIEKKIAAINETSLQTISAVNILSFKVRLAKKAGVIDEQLIDNFLILVTKFRKEKNNVDTELAVYPELAVVAHELYGHYKDLKYEEIAKEIFLWLKLHQRTDGAFAARVGGGQPYTRGTTKVFEVLSLEPNINKEAIFSALEWIWSMQYDATNTFYIKKNLVPNIIGSFRSGVGNSDIWIDSAAHFIIGVSRLLLDKNSFK